MKKPQHATRSALPVPARGLAATAGVAVPTSLWLVAPTASLILLLVEVGLTVIIVVAALFGPEQVSQRAFRILGSRAARRSSQ